MCSSQIQFNQTNKPKQIECEAKNKTKRNLRSNDRFAANTPKIYSNIFEICAVDTQNKRDMKKSEGDTYKQRQLNKKRRRIREHLDNVWFGLDGM